MTEKQKLLESVILAGSKLSNFAFNVAQENGRIPERWAHSARDGVADRDAVDAITDEQLLAVARNLRAGLLHARDYDDEVATIYNVLLFAVRPLRSQLRDLTVELEREKGQLASALRRADAAEMALTELRGAARRAVNADTFKTPGVGRLEGIQRVLLDIEALLPATEPAAAMAKPSTPQR